MREERGQIAGNIVITEPYTLWGSVGGDLTVGKGGKVYVRGTIYGNLLIDPGGRCHIFGQIMGHVVVAEDTKVIHSGVVKGDVTNNGGRLLVERIAKVGGRIKAKFGETKVEGEHAVER